MADVTISDLTAVTTTTTADNVEIEQSGPTTKRATIAEILALAWATGVISPSQITGDQNDYAPTGVGTAGILRLDTDAERTLTGLNAGSANDPKKVLVNIGSNELVLSDENASSTAANRFALGGPGQLRIRPGGAVFLVYDTTSSRWRPVASYNAQGETDHGTVTTGTTTPERSQGEQQSMTNGGASTLAPATERGEFLLTISNNASAGNLTTSGFDEVVGDAFDTTDGNVFECLIVNDGDTSSLQVRAKEGNA